MFEIIKEESDFIEIEPHKGVRISSFQWEAAKLSLLKNKKVIYVFNDNRVEMTIEQAKDIIYPRAVKNKIADLEDHEETLMKELIETRKDKKEMKKFLKKVNKIFRDSPK